MLRTKVKDIFMVAVEAVKPQYIVQKVVTRNGLSEVMVNKCPIPLNNNVYVVGFGKAAMGMAAGIEKQLEDHIVRGVISIPVGLKNLFTKTNKQDLLLIPSSKIEVYEGAQNNLPDENSLQAAEQIEKLVKTLGKDDLLFVLISGGGSALLPAPIPPVMLSEKCEVIKLLAHHGANILELNSVRKRLSRLKGGGLAALSAPAQVIGLILSDVIGDPLDVIASGPTVENTDSDDQALSVVKKYGLQGKLPSSALQLISAEPSSKPATNFSHVRNFLIGSNSIAVQQCSAYAESLGFSTVCLTTRLEGETIVAGSFYAHLARTIWDCYNTGKVTNTESLMELPAAKYFPPDVFTKLWEVVGDVVKKRKPLCVISGGETVVKVTGSGVGGRNQEMALACGLQMDRLFKNEDWDKSADIVFLSAGTDGIDGPTLAAGASSTPDLVRKASVKGFFGEEFLKNNDSNSFFNKACPESLVEIGHTGTNVMDIQLLAFEFF